MGNYQSELDAFDYKASQMLGRNVTPGRTFWVSSVTGTASSVGRQPRSPVSKLATVLDSLTSADANTGVTIVCMPGHAEALTSATSIAADIAGVTVIGLGEGRSRPTFTWGTSTNATWAVSAANFRVDNCRFDLTGVDAVPAGFTIAAADFAMNGCEVEFANTGGQATVAILTTAAANRMKILNNYMFGSTDAGTATAIRVVGGSDIQIRNNTIIGSFTNTLGGIENNTTDATNIVIDGNLIVNRTGGSSKAVVLTATATGIVSNNRLGVLSGTAPISGAAIDFVGGNYYKAAAGVAAGTLL